MAITYKNRAGELITVEDCVNETVSDGSHTIGELYEHRYRLFLALCATASRSRKPWMTKQHAPGASPMYEGYFLVGFPALGEDNSIDYHLPLHMWNLALAAGCEVLEHAPVWDGIVGASLKRLEALIYAAQDTRKPPSSEALSAPIARLSDEYNHARLAVLKRLREEESKKKRTQTPTNTEIGDEAVIFAMDTGDCESKGNSAAVTDSPFCDWVSAVLRSDPTSQELGYLQEISHFRDRVFRGLGVPMELMGSAASEDPAPKEPKTDTEDP